MCPVRPLSKKTAKLMYIERQHWVAGTGEVETGITNGVDIEILSGLEEGDTIYLAAKSAPRQR